jgi:hypothetical protein
LVQVCSRNPTVEKLTCRIVEVASSLGDDIFRDTERIEQGYSGNDKVDKNGSQHTDDEVPWVPKNHRVGGVDRRLRAWTTVED